MYCVIIPIVSDNTTERVERLGACQGYTARRAAPPGKNPSLYNYGEGEPEAWMPGGSSALHLFSVDPPARGAEAASLKVAQIVRMLVCEFTLSQ